MTRVDPLFLAALFTGGIDAAVGIIVTFAAVAVLATVSYRSAVGATTQWPTGRLTLGAAMVIVTVVAFRFAVAV